MKVKMAEQLKRRIEHQAFLKIAEEVGSYDLIDVTKEEIANVINEVLDEMSEGKIFPIIPLKEEFIEMIQQVNSSIYQENVARTIEESER